MKRDFFIDPDIRKAETLPASFYQDDALFEDLKEKVFINSWQFVGDQSLVPFTNSVFPFYLLEHYIDEPLLIIRDQNDDINCISNVCTHRGNILVHHPGTHKHIQCLYHGRRFGTDGRFQFMPEFKEAENFPRPCDHLKSFPIRNWSQFLFASLEPAFDFQSVINKLEERLYFLPIDEFKLSKERSKDYLVNAHWALYCDNFLEGFHIPFVHNDLNQALDYGLYTTEVYDYCNLQIGYTDEATDTFDLPKGHPDYGKNVAAYYYWIYPNLMLNFYPWGLSINVVKPLARNRTRVSFISYVWDESKIDTGAGAILEKVEREDEFVVEGVFRGLQSRHYQRGRFSPTREKGVHQFQRMLSEAISQ